MSPQRPQISEQEVGDLLAEMARQGKAAIEVSQRPAPPSVKAPKVRYTHEAMIDLMLENPWISQNQLAAHFGYSPGWISTVLTSDAFQSKYAARREELLDPELRITLQERFRALTEQSLRVLQEKLSKPADQVSDQLALRAAELGAKSLGLGQTHQVTVAVTSEERLASLAHRLVALQGRTSPETIDVDSREITR